MVDASDTSGLGCGHAAAPAPPPVPCNLLLVSASKRWTQAVRAAAAEIGGGVSRCDARGAVIRLASIVPRYSHLLLDPGSADGLLERTGEPDRRRARIEHRDAAAWHRHAAAPYRRYPLGQPRRGAAGTDLPPLANTRAGQWHPMHLTELREALAGAMIETRYQPIVRLADRQPVALEALARLNHPTRGTLPPDEFVPQIEDAGLAARLTDVVADRALADMAGPLLRPHALDITLNFPLDVLLVPDALRRLDARRRAAGVAASMWSSN